MNLEQSFKKEVRGQDDHGDALVEVQAGGRYMTPPHLATIAQTQDDLKLHMDAHKLCAALVTTPAPAPTPRDSKPAKLERPRMELDWI